MTVCHHVTRSLAAHSRRADALFVAVGKPRLIRADMVKPGAAVIDIGINRDRPGRREPHRRRRRHGDVKEVASWITPVPGGVGPVTVAILLRNTMVALSRQRQDLSGGVWPGAGPLSGKRLLTTGSTFPSAPSNTPAFTTRKYVLSLDLVAADLVTTRC